MLAPVTDSLLAIGYHATYHGPPPLTPRTAATEWTFDVPTVLVAVLLGLGYRLATRRLARREVPWPRVRSVGFGCGVGLILLLGVSFLDVYADVLFWVRAAQVIVLLMVVPLLLALGSPVALALATLPTSAAERLRSFLAGRLARFLTYPATASILLVATPWLLYFTGYYHAVLTSGAVDTTMRLQLLVVGFLYFYSRLQLDPVPRHYPHLVSLVITFVEVIFDAALGLVLWLGPTIVAQDYYLALHRTWGPSARMDQIIGAGVLWIVGDLAGLPFLGALMNRMAADDAHEAAAIDRALDEEAANAYAGSAESNDASTAPPTPARLWWEDDPVLAERFHRRRPE